MNETMKPVTAAAAERLARALNDFGWPERAEMVRQLAAERDEAWRLQYDTVQEFARAKEAWTHERASLMAERDAAIQDLRTLFDAIDSAGEIDSDAIEGWLRSAPQEKIIAFHDLAHAAMFDRFGYGIKPSQRTLKKARAVIG